MHSAKSISIAAVALLAALVSGCGGGGGGGSDDSQDSSSNTTPVANAGIDQVVDEGIAVNLDGNLSDDADGSIAGYSWSQTDSSGISVTLINPTSATPSFTAPAVTAATVLTFSLTVTDNDGDSSVADSVDITVNNVNVIPTANAGPDQVVDEGDAVNLDGNLSDDADGSIAGYSWNQTDSSGISVTLINPTSATPSFTAPAVTAATVLTFSLTVTDNDGAGSVADSVDITVNDTGGGNLPPNANAGPDRIVDEGDAVSLDGNLSSDADGSVTGYSWSQTAGTSVTLTGPNTVTPTFTAPLSPAENVLTFSLTVTDNDGASSIADTINVVVSNPDGILFWGDPNELTSNVVIDYDSGDETSPGEISTDANRMQFDRTNLDIALAETTTVAQANTLLQSIGGRIVNMLAGVNIILVKIPDPGSLAGLDTVTATVDASPIVDWVQQAEMGDQDSLPGNYDPATSDLSLIGHQIAVLAPSAWNARAALDYPAVEGPLLLQSDFFGNGVPDSDFDLNILDSADFGSGSSSFHGYHVLGIVSGRHNTDTAATSDRDLVTGIYPGTIDVRVVDRRRYNLPRAENELVRIIRDSGRRIVMNTSMHGGCPRPPQLSCVQGKTLSWLRKLRGDIAYFAGLRSTWEDTSLIVSASAGNFRISETDTYDASLNSQYAAARLLGGLTVVEPGSSFGNSVPNTLNALVVEDRVTNFGVFDPSCLSIVSKYPGDISAIGTDVWSFFDPAGTANFLSGTSMSTAQVSGLTAYLWAMRPGLGPDEVVDIIQRTAATPSGDGACGVVPSPVIDAYAAVLAVDAPNALDPVTPDLAEAPARLAIFDILGDSGIAGSNLAFDQDDLVGFVNAFEAADGIARDFSRFDLNGDGYTGGTVRAAPFNLDLDAVPVYGPANQDIEGNPVTYDENSLTDWEVLCYYAYSPLYTGTTTARSAAFATHFPKCGVP